MKFGKDFTTHLEETIPEWKDKFLCYKPLKKLLKNLPPQNLPPAGDLPPGGGAGGAGGRNSVELQDWFVRILSEELHKFNEFYVDKEEEFVIRFQELKERIQLLKEKSNRHGFSTMGSEFSEEMMDIRKDLVMIHGEMVLLKTYSSLNLAGLVKILKKYDKRTGGVLRLPFTQLAVRQPFCTTDPLTRLVHECEANLELLFPLEAEVVDTPENESTPPLNNNAASSSTKSQTQTPSSLGAETVEIYRGTLAAMKAIRGLQKASSTYDPFSLSSLFKNHDTESAGAVTAENSAADSVASDGNEADQDGTNSV